MAELDGLSFHEHQQVIPPFGLRLPARMTVLPLAADELALVSPIPIDDVLAAELARAGRVRFLIAPNLLHHLHLSAAQQRYPEAVVVAPPGLRAKRPDLRIERTLDQPLPAPLAAVVDALRIEGAPAIDEFVLYHRPSKSVVVTELVFNVVRPEGWFTHLVLALVGCRGVLAQSRAWRLFIKDRERAAASMERVLALPFTSLVVAHGENVTVRAREQLARALAERLPLRRALPA